MSGFIFPAIWEIFKTAVEKTKNIFSKTALSVKAIFDIVIAKEVSLYGFTERINAMGTQNLKPAPEPLNPEPREAIQHEDAALKTAFRYFSDVLLPYFGIKKKAVGITATELVHLDVKKFYEDFNLVMDDDSWAHFEFESKNEGLKGLKRFRVYEALASYQNKVPVTTYVLFSGKVKNPMTQFTEGVNTFKIVPIIMQDHDADLLIEKLKRKQEHREELTKEDLALLSICLLMSGKMSLKDRAKEAFQITKEAEASQEEAEKAEAVLYVMADKFLESGEIDELMEVIGMTRLGQKLVNRGIEQGREQGKEEGRLAGREEEKLEIARNLIGLLDEKVISQKTGLPLEAVMELKKKEVQAPVL